MCGAPDIKPPPPPPIAPPVLEQVAPKSASSSDSQTRKKAKGLSRYKIDESSVTPNTSGLANTSGLGGIPKKTGV